MNNGANPSMLGGDGDQSGALGVFGCDAMQAVAQNRDGCYYDNRNNAEGF
jgi:hypothetical protein